MYECIYSLGDAQIFSTLDANSGYWQIGVEERDSDKTALVSHHGLYRYKRLPLGLKNAPRTFQRLIHIILASVKWKYAIVYLDDIIIFSKNVDEHFHHINNVLRMLKEAGMTLKLKKCFYIQKRVDYLGHMVSPGRLLVAAKTVQAVQKMLPPTYLTSLRSFLVLCNVYRKFVPNFARIAAPLTKKLRKDNPDKWERLKEDETEAFNKFKDFLAKPPVLALPRLGQTYTVDSDACDKQVRSVLLQEQEDVNEHPLGYLSRTLIPAERNYDTTQRKCLEIVWAILLLRLYLEGTSFVLRTDHDLLKWTIGLSKAPKILARWRLRLQEIDFEVRHHSGVKHKAPDEMSRMPTESKDNTELDDDVLVFVIKKRHTHDVQKTQQ